MGLRDDALNYLRSVFGRERREREKAESPSAEAEKHLPSSIFSVWGREDIGGLLSVSQNLMDRYADYEQMDEYPDINCFHRDTRFFDGHRLVKLGDAVGQSVTVMCADGVRRPATVEKFGVQKFQRVVIKPVTKNGRTNIRRSFVVTPNHRWLLQDGTVTESLSVGDRLAAAPLTIRTDKNDLGFLHGFVFGDGSRHTYYSTTYLLRLCGQKREFLDRLAPLAHLVGSPPSFGGDPLLTIHSEVDLKSLPDENAVDEGYIASFIEGWLAADGCDIKNGSTGLYTQDETAAEWLMARAAFYGYSVVGHSLATKATNYGDRAAPLHTILLRKDVPTEWKVESIVDEGITDEAFCVVEPETHSFMLEGGVITGNCLAGDTMVYAVEGTLITPMTIHELAVLGGGFKVLAYDVKLGRLVTVPADNPRLSGEDVELISLKLSNGETIRCTKEHKFLTKTNGYVNAEHLEKGVELMAPFPGFSTRGLGMFTHFKTGTVTITEGPSPAGKDRVYDITTRTHNFVANGVVVHNSANHYFTNDATQPDIDTGKTVWVHCQDDAIKGIADTLLAKKLRIEDEIWSMAYTLVKYGNNYEEVLVTENGVVGTNFLPVPTMRRVEQSNGALIGYVQDITGKFTQDAADLRGMLAGQSKIPDHVAVFEDWQVLHMRLRGTARRSPYGYAVSDGARWIWKRLVLLEDAMLIYKLTRAPARYAFYIDVTDIPSDKVESFLRKAKQDLKKTKMVNPRTQRLDMRFNPMCLAGDTKVPLLDGTTKTIVDMVAAYERGEQQWVYSVDPNDGNRLKPGKVVWAGKTRRDAQLVKITLDNGESIRVTPDHKMMRRDGSKVFAQDLVPGDSLMPFRTKLAAVNRRTAPNYEMVYDPGQQKWVFTHRMVAESLGIATGASGCVIHHEDCNPRNNDPKNLTEMEWGAHKALHHKLSRAAAEKLVAYNKSPEKRAETAQLNHKLNKPALMRAAITPEIREKQKAAARAHKQEMWADPERRASASQAMKIVFSDEFVNAIRELVSEEPDAGAPRIAALANERGLVELLKKDNPTKANKIKSIHRDMLRWMSQRLGFKNFADFKSLALCDNHKVAAIEWLTEREDSYCITVDESHTFATSCGVVVYNSNDEDFFIAVRENRELARVEVLQGPDYQATEDVEYFAKKLHGVLKVPRSYLGQEDAIPGRAILSNEDVRAARVTMAVQRELRNGILRLIQIDLAARGIDPFRQDIQVQMTVPSGIYELVAHEIKNARADYAQRIQPFVSKRYILKHVFKMNDDEIALLEKEIQREQERQMAMGGAPGIPGLPDSSGSLGPPPPDADIGPPPGQLGRPNTPAEWTRYNDQLKRIEEQRDRLTERNIQQINDKLGALLENDKRFAARLSQQQAFMQEFKATAFARSQNGRLYAAPVGRGHRNGNGR